MNKQRQILSYMSWRESIIGKVDRLQQEVLRTSHKTPAQVLFQAYETLTDEQKIAFILTGGVPSLFHYQRHSIQQMRADPDRETGQLPIPC